MGTRHLITVFKDGEYKIAQYGQWDCYPEGQGLDILNFLKSVNIDEFKNKLNNVFYITEEELEATYTEFGYDFDKSDGFVSCDIADRHDKKYPELSRDTGAGILDIIYNSNGVLKVLNSLDFAKDSLMCEWAYCIDFDKNTFEIFKGFNTDPINITDRFYTDTPYKSYDETIYYPVKLKAIFELNNLPDKKTFLKICDSEIENA